MSDSSILSSSDHRDTGTFDFEFLTPAALLVARFLTSDAFAVFTMFFGTTFDSFCLCCVVSTFPVLIGCLPPFETIPVLIGCLPPFEIIPVSIGCMSPFKVNPVLIDCLLPFRIVLSSFAFFSVVTNSCRESVLGVIKVGLVPLILPLVHVMECLSSGTRRPDSYSPRQPGQFICNPSLILASTSSAPEVSK